MSKLLIVVCIAACTGCAASYTHNADGSYTLSVDGRDQTLVAATSETVATAGTLATLSASAADEFATAVARAITAWNAGDYTAARQACADAMHVAHTHGRAKQGPAARALVDPAPVVPDDGTAAVQADAKAAWEELER